MSEGFSALSRMSAHCGVDLEATVDHLAKDLRG